MQSFVDNLVRGDYDAATQQISDAGMKDRIAYVKFLEEAEIESFKDKSKVTLAETGELYRGYSFDSRALRSAFLQTERPWTPYARDGKPLTEMQETYHGMYVTALRNKGYVTRKEYGVQVTFSWPVIRAMFVLGEISFGISNDVAAASEDFSDMNLMIEMCQELIAVFGPKGQYTTITKIPYSKHWPFGKHKDYYKYFETVEDDKVFGFLQNEDVAAYYSLTRGSNRELCINTKTDDYPQSGWDWNFMGYNVVKDIAEVETSAVPPEAKRRRTEAPFVDLAA